MRLDVYLVEKGLFSTRNKAQTAIKDNASISKIIINSTDESVSNYNSHINIDDESICVCRDINITIE